MLKHFAPFLKASFIFLLSLDSKSRAFLSKICWFVPITSLEKDETDPHQQSDIDISANWSRLWHSAQKLYVSICSSSSEKIENKGRNKPSISLHTRKIYELLFLFLASSLRQLMTCRHTSGAPGDIRQSGLIPLKSTMRVFAIVLFLFSELNFLRSCYVYSLCRSMSHRCRPYLYGCGVS